MADKKPPPSLDDLDARLKAAQSRHRGETDAPDEAKRGSALSLAFRIGVELVAALIVGVGIGYLLDLWLGTKPWFLLLFFVLGSAAGIMNVFRVTSGMGGAVGYRPAPGDGGRSEKKDRTDEGK
ncbi:MAG: AtpZ/AtpI family protein [Pseudomonadota bacterium]